MAKPMLCSRQGNALVEALIGINVDESGLKISAVLSSLRPRHSENQCDWSRYSHPPYLVSRRDNGSSIDPCREMSLRVGRVWVCLARWDRLRMKDLADCGPARAARAMRNSPVDTSRWSIAIRCPTCHRARSHWRCTVQPVRSRQIHLLHCHGWGSFPDVYWPSSGYAAQMYRPTQMVSR
jgi:hypothetical protein